MQIAVVHDYFTQMGGAEKVAEQIALMFPNPSIFSTVALKDRLPPGLEKYKVNTTWMQHLPLMKKYYRAYFLLYPSAIHSLDLSDYDLVISSSSGYAKGVHTKPGALHICYCHTPMRWAWGFDQYSAHEKMGLIKRQFLKHTTKHLRKWDLRASRQPDCYVANSQAVAERIRRFYGRAAKVIHPPIDLQRFRPVDEVEDYYIVLSRLVSYKRIDLAVEACTRLKKRLIVIGAGPDRARLQSIAGPTVEFVGRLPDTEVEYYASRCRALIFPGEEDFGMAPLEIAAAGRPTIAFKAGGATETIIEGVTGAFFYPQTTDSLMKSILEFERVNWNSNLIRTHALGFSIDVFRTAFKKLLAEFQISHAGGIPQLQSEASPHVAAYRVRESSNGIPLGVV